MKGMQKAVGIALVGALIASPLTNAFAQQPDEAIRNASIDAKRDISGTMWLAIGCLGGIWGLAASYIYTPSVPAAALVGKSPEYVAHYTDAYRREVRSIQSRNAIWGCLVSGVSYAACWFFWVILGGI